MTEYICNECGERFDEPEIESTTYEDYYGVGSEFIGKTHLEVEICPYCGSEDIDEVDDEEEEDHDVDGMMASERQDKTNRVEEIVGSLLKEKGWSHWPDDDDNTFRKGTIELKCLCFGCESAWIRARCGEDYEIRRSYHTRAIERESPDYIAERICRQAEDMAKLLASYMGICQHLDMALNEVFMGKEEER